MSKVTTIPEIIEAAVDTEFQVVKGTIKTLYKPKTGESDKGPWSFQNGVLSDGKNEVKFTLTGRDELPLTFKGKQVYFLAHHGDRGWSGLYRHDETYNGKTNPVLWVTKTAEVVEATKHEGAQPPSGTAPAATASVAPPPQTDAAQEARKFVARRASLLRITLKAAHALAAECKAELGLEFTPDQFQGINGCLFIAADRAGLADALPVNLMLKDLAGKTKATPPREPDVEQCVCGAYKKKGAPCGVATCPTNQPQPAKCAQCGTTLNPGNQVCPNVNCTSNDVPF